MGPSDTAAGSGGGGGVDPPLEPVPSRAGRVKVRRGWSNTTGELIRRVCEDVWVVERACTLRDGSRVEWGGGGGGGSGQGGLVGRARRGSDSVGGAREWKGGCQPGEEERLAGRRGRG